MSGFQDQVHIDVIRRRLWCGREFGQAAVMVGAGFSRNAEHASSRTKKFPLWKDVSEEMHKALYPTGIKSHLKNEPLRLASEYEAEFGVQELSDLIERIIPDAEYSPGRLHELLLYLPWSDVYTTNYDTLIEKTLPKIYDQKYDVVVTATDIPGRMKPRIVKLHGSFPSIRPFIITEEHYRCYPKNYAPFVNMVQQSIMENVFCLIGFSGSDPNFLAWSGWVRDNLGDSRPNIYLCGVFDFSKSERKVLESRKVIPIDLSPLFPKSIWPDKEIRHAKAIEWLLLNLLYGKPPDGRRWPSKVSPTLWTPSPGLPDIPPPNTIATDPGDRFPHDLPNVPPEKLKGKAEIWKKQRQEFPGWNIVPYHQRNELWNQTEPWIYLLIQNLEKFSPLDQLLILFELNWRLEKTLTPLFPYMAEKTGNVLRGFNPFHTLINLETASIRSDVAEYRKLEWTDIQKMWTALGFAVARDAREQQNEVEYSYWVSLLEKVAHLNPEWIARLSHERALYYLNKADFLNIARVLESWPENFDQLDWEMKRASILAEIGDRDKAEVIVERCLSEIRKRIVPYKDDFSLFSQEMWAMLFLRSLKLRSSDSTTLFNTYRERAKKLKSYDCDPYFEMDMLEFEVGKLPLISSDPQIKREFDPGKIIISHRLETGLNIYRFRDAYNAFRIFEEAGIPMRCGSVTMFSKVVVDAARFIKRENPVLAFNLIVRERHGDSIKEWFDRASIAMLTDDEVNYFFNESYGAIKQLMKKVSESSLTQVRESEFLIPELDIFTEFVSRLAFRLDNKKLNELLTIACELHKDKAYCQTHFLNENKDHLFGRVFLALEPSETCMNMEKLLSLPVPTENDFAVVEHGWQDPLELLKWPDNFKLGPNFDTSTWAKSIMRLTDLVKNGKPLARRIATWRLVRLFEINGLNESEKEHFIEALWSRINPQTNMPSETNMIHAAFLLFSDKANNAEEKLKKYLFSWIGKSIVSYETKPDGGRVRTLAIGSGTGTYSNYTSELEKATKFAYPQKYPVIDWTTEEAVEIFNKISNWWDAEKKNFSDSEFLNKELDSLYKEIISISEIVGNIVLPRFINVENHYKESAVRLIEDMERKGFCVLDSLPSILFVTSEKYDEVVLKLTKGLNSERFQVADKAVAGIYYWLLNYSGQKIGLEPKSLLDELINRLALRRQPGLGTILDVITHLIKVNFVLFNQGQIDSILMTLEHLIIETELKKGSHADQEVQGRAISISDKPDYREKSSDLAHGLYLQFNKGGGEIPAILEEWRKVSKEDVLPEVRRHWHDIP